MKSKGHAFRRDANYTSSQTANDRCISIMIIRSSKSKWSNFRVDGICRPCTNGAVKVNEG